MVLGENYWLKCIRFVAGDACEWFGRRRFSKTFSHDRSIIFELSLFVCLQRIRRVA